MEDTNGTKPAGDQGTNPNGEKKSSFFGSINAIQGAALVGTITGYIIGPLIMFGAIGYWLSKKFDNQMILFGALILALVISNILVYMNVEKIMKRFFKK